MNTSPKSPQIVLASVGPLALGDLIPENTWKLSVVFILLIDQNSATAVIKCGQKVPDISNNLFYDLCNLKVFGSSVAVFLGSGQESGIADVHRQEKTFFTLSHSCQLPPTPLLRQCWPIARTHAKWIAQNVLDTMCKMVKFGII